MRVVVGSASLMPTGPTAVAIGIFDGVHKGHQALLNKAVELAKADGITACAYTFDPHPAALFTPQKAPLLIEPLDKRLERFAGLGIAVAIVEKFDPAFAGKTPEAFIDEVVLGDLRARHIIVGEDFRFGKGQAGDVKTLRTAASRGFDLHAIGAVRMDDGTRIASTAVRAFVGDGEMDKADAALGRPYQLIGTVERGAGRGAGIGFATANIQPSNMLLPARGVYACYAHGPFGTLPAVTNVGFTPAFGADALKIEAHLLGYGGEALYGAGIELDFIARLRGEKKFDSVDALKAQIAADIDAAKNLLAASGDA